MSTLDVIVATIGRAHGLRGEVAEFSRGLHGGVQVGLLAVPADFGAFVFNVVKDAHVGLPCCQRPAVSAA